MFYIKFPKGNDEYRKLLPNFVKN